MSKTAASYPQTGRAQTLRLVKMSSMVAISIVLVYLIHFPIFPAVAFLEYDPADISILIGTFAFGPAAGVLLTLVTSVIQGVPHQKDQDFGGNRSRSRNDGHGGRDAWSQPDYHAAVYGRVQRDGLGSDALYRGL